MLGAEIHGWRDAESKVSAQTELAQHTHMETSIPTVLVATDDFLNRGSVFVDGNHLRTHIHKFHILEVRSHQHAKVEGTQVGVRPIFNGPLLSLGLNDEQTGTDKGKYVDNLFFHANTNVGLSW